MTRPAHVCPYCGEDALTEQVGRVWFCNVCARAWVVPQARQAAVGPTIAAGVTDGA